MTVNLTWTRSDYDSGMSCSVVDLYLSVSDEDDGDFGYEVTQVYGSGGVHVCSGDGFHSEEQAIKQAELWFFGEGGRELMDRYLGWFDNPNEPTPAFTPDWRYCPFCTETLSRHPSAPPITTISLLVPGDYKSYFYRAHKPCYEKDNKRTEELEDDFIELIMAYADSDTGKS